MREVREGYVCLGAVYLLVGLGGSVITGRDGAGRTGMCVKCERTSDKSYITPLPGRPCPLVPAVPRLPPVPGRYQRTATTRPAADTTRR